jgi:ABC-2 type transport system permease protein
MTFKQQLTALLTVHIREIRRIFSIWIFALLPPIITVALYFVIFGQFIGANLMPIHGVSYMQYITPGLIAIPMISAAYSNTSSSVFMSKFHRNIEEILISPMPNYIILLGFLSGSLFRVILMTTITTLTALFFTHIELHHVTILIATLFLTSISFGSLGFLNGVFARKFDDAGFIPVFVLTPLTYLGGVFYSIQSLPLPWRHLSLFNPVFYIIDAFRYGMLGISASNPMTALLMLLVFAVLFFILNLYVLRQGFGLRK